ncbi:tRNA intron endonuclease, partial [Hysterangium stoloniferum]
YFKISSLTKKYPHLSGALFQTFNDLLLAQRWYDLEIRETLTAKHVIIEGKRPETHLTHIVVPCHLSDSLSMKWLTSIFEDLNDVPELYLAIISEDSSIVYYRISSGIVKPQS